MANTLIIRSRIASSVFAASMILVPCLAEAQAPGMPGVPNLRPSGTIGGGRVGSLTGISGATSQRLGGSLTPSLSSTSINRIAPAATVGIIQPQSVPNLGALAGSSRVLNPTFVPSPSRVPSFNPVVVPPGSPINPGAIGGGLPGPGTPSGNGLPPGTGFPPGGGITGIGGGTIPGAPTPPIGATPGAQPGKTPPMPDPVGDKGHGNGDKAGSGTAIGHYKPSPSFNTAGAGSSTASKGGGGSGSTGTSETGSSSESTNVADATGSSDGRSQSGPSSKSDSAQRSSDNAASGIATLGLDGIQVSSSEGVATLAAMAVSVGSNGNRSDDGASANNPTGSAKSVTGSFDERKNNQQGRKRQSITSVAMLLSAPLQWDFGKPAVR